MCIEMGAGARVSPYERPPLKFGFPWPPTTGSRQDTSLYSQRGGLGRTESPRQVRKSPPFLGSAFSFFCSRDADLLALLSGPRWLQFGCRIWPRGGALAPSLPSCSRTAEEFPVLYLRFLSFFFLIPPPWALGPSTPPSCSLGNFLCGCNTREKGTSTCPSPFQDKG